MTCGPQPSAIKTLLTIGGSLLALSALLTAPLESGGTLVEATCQWTMTAEQTPLIWDARHVAFFTVLALVAWSLATRARFGIVTLGLLGYAIALELSQSIFSRGHCRIWDLLADLVGMIFALVILVTWRAVRTRSRLTP
jgi:VanZ family protein